jgi:hypothetical protein
MQLAYAVITAGLRCCISAHIGQHSKAEQEQCIHALAGYCSAHK